MLVPKLWVCITHPMNVFFPFQKVKKEVGDVTIVVNNAGTVYPADLRSTKDEEITKTFEVNILGHFWVSVSQKHFWFVHLLLRYMTLITDRILLDRKDTSGQETGQIFAWIKNHQICLGRRATESLTQGHRIQVDTTRQNVSYLVCLVHQYLTQSLACTKNSTNVCGGLLRVVSVHLFNALSCDLIFSPPHHDFVMCPHFVEF